MDSEGECPSGLASRRVILTEEQDVNKNQGLAAWQVSWLMELLLACGDKVGISSPARNDGSTGSLGMG